MPFQILQHGKYHIMETIGKGGMGKVHLGLHVMLGINIVLKELLVSNPKDPSYVKDAIDEFKAEAQLLYANVRHPAFPTVKDFFEEGGKFYLVMDLMEGANMQTLIERFGQLHVDMVCWIGDRILSGLAYIHRYDIVHKDIKPGNILLNLAEHRANLVDFGIAKSKVNLSSSSMTPNFAAPEQFKGLNVTTATDVYQLGATMYYAITGKLPKPADKRKDDDLEPFTAFAIKGADRKAATELFKLVSKALSIDSSKRWGRHKVPHRSAVMLESEGMLDDLRRVRHELHVSNNLEEHV
ncbi:MAG: serine/threonine-protein kinase [archaeon]